MVVQRKHSDDEFKQNIHPPPKKKKKSRMHLDTVQVVGFVLALRWRLRDTGKVRHTLRSFSRADMPTEGGERAHRYKSENSPILPDDDPPTVPVVRIRIQNI